jgi:predicted methyltransferase
MILKARFALNIPAFLLAVLLFTWAPEALAGAGVKAMSDSDDALLRTIIAGDHRKTKNRARDAFRHPFETLSFFGLRSDMTVAEILPGGGWYLEIIAPFLKSKGRYYAANWANDEPRPRYRGFLKRFKEMLAARPDLYGKVTVTEFAKHKTNFAPPGSADLVLTFRNLHNWPKRGTLKLYMAAIFKVLKPGGILGVVDHRANDRLPVDPKALSGYVHEAQMIKFAEEAGLRFLAKSDINANPRDMTQHPEGVWTLPPSLRLKDKFRDKYLAIGESDRLTMKFVKPAK